MPFSIFKTQQALSRSLRLLLVQAILRRGSAFSAAIPALVGFVIVGFTASDFAKGQVSRKRTREAATLHLASDILPQAQLHSLGQQMLFSVGDSVPADTVDFSNLLRWGAWPGLSNRPAAWLADGSWVAGKLSWKAGVLNVDSDWLDCPGFELSSLRGIVVQPPISLNAWLRLQLQMEQASGDEDQVWLASGTRLSGVLDLSGVADEGGGVASIDIGSKSIELDWEDVRAVVFSPALLGPCPPWQTPVIGLKDGSLLACSRIQEEADQLTLELSYGLAVKTWDNSQDFARAVRYLSGQPQKVQQLSEQKVAQYKSLSESYLLWELGVDQDCYGRPLQGVQAWAGVVPKGLAMHSSSQVAYRLSGDAQTFLAELSFANTRAGGDARLGSVTCRVLVARDGKLVEVASVDMDRANDLSQPALIKADVGDARLLVLRTEESTRGPLGDHVVWLDARLATPANQE